MDNYSTTLDRVFLALGDPTRRAIVARLGAGSASVKELAAPFPMALPSFMKHLAVLERSGLIHSKKEGRVRTCRIEPRALTGARDWLTEQRAAWESRTDRLAAHVESLHAKEKSHGRGQRT